MALAGAAAVLPVISIAGFEIVLGAAILSMIVLRVKPRWPPIWLPISLFILGTVISWLASGDLRGGLPQIKKFYVYAMVFVVASTFRNVAQRFDGWRWDGPRQQRRRRGSDSISFTTSTKTPWKSIRNFTMLTSRIASRDFSITG